MPTYQTIAVSLKAFLLWERFSMNYLTQGGFSDEKLDAYFEIVNFKSEDIKAAIREHLCRGRTKELAAVGNVNESNLNRALKKLNDKVAKVEKIKAIDWKYLKSQKWQELFSHKRINPWQMGMSLL